MPDINRQNLDIRFLLFVGSQAEGFAAKKTIEKFLQEGGTLHLREHKGLGLFATNNNKTPLMIAAGCNNSRVVQELVTYYLKDPTLDINAYDVNKHTALHFAAQADPFKDNGDTITYLLKHPKILIDAKDNHGNTPLQLAIQTYDSIQSNYNTSDINKLKARITSLLDAGAETKEVFPLVIGSTDLSMIFLEHAKGLDIEKEYEGGNTLLILAAQAGNMAAVTHLLKLGANISHLNHDGQNALYAALEAGHTAIVDLLAPMYHQVEEIHFSPKK
ncbi:MAG TPA: ankyrin repeat domain-containing protein [Legionellaceae bacterium]|nr:ankyrin repeat domain-containing protein [Legionellaceae bacterium]